MKLWDGIRHWGGRLDWRRHAPAAGSAAAHAVIGLAVAAMMGASGRPLPKPRDAVEPPAIEVSLIADSLPLPARPTTPRPAPKSEPTDTAPPISGPVRKNDKPAAAPDAPSSAPAATREADKDSVYLGPSPFAQPARKGGLEGLATNDPCTARVGIKPKDCVTNWAASVGSMDSVMPRSEEEMARYHAEFVTRCKYRVGCEPIEVLNNGARSFGNKSPMASGAGGVQGINELVGRLGFNPDHTDPGFGD